MAVITRPTTPLPNPGDEIEAEQVRDWINNILLFIEEGSADEANVNLAATNGIVGKSTNQTITGTKSFASTSTGSGANLTANFILNPSDSAISANDGPRIAFQTLNASGEVHDYAYIDAIATTLTSTGEAGKLVFSVYESGSAVEAFSITGAGPQFNSNIVSYKDANGADVTISIGTSEPESFNIVADNGSGNKTLEQVTFTSKTASGTANHGKMVFNVDETTILSILDTGLEYAGTLTGTGSATFYKDANNADVSLAMGTSATESFNVITSNGASDKELYQVDFTTKTAESDADRGKFVFNVDEAEIATIDDDGIELASGKSITAPALTNLGLLYSNSGVISPAPRLFSDGSSTLRIGTSGGSAGGSILLYGDTSGSQVSFNGGSDDVTFNQYEIIHQSSLADKPTITLKNSHADATAGKIIFTKDPSSGQGADNDVMGTVEFFGTDASNNAVEKLAYIDSYIVEADHGSEAAGIRFFVAENDATVTQGLSINGSASVDGRVDVTLGAAATSVITIPGDIDLAGDIDVDGTLEADAITLDGTALGSLYSPVAGSSSIVTTGTIGTGTWAATDIAVAHGGTGSSTASGARTNLGVAIGSNVQAYDADLTAIAGLSNSDGNFIVGSASGWVAESGATARTSLGLGTMAVAATSDYATLSSPALTGTPTAPTAGSSVNTTQIATTAYVTTAVAASGGGGAYNAFSIKTSGYTASSGDQLIGNHASSAFTITLPSSPSAGNTVTIKNVGAATITVGRNSEKINSAAEDGTLLENAGVQLVYVDSTIGWASL